MTENAGTDEPDPVIRRLGGDPPSPWEEAFGYSRVVTAGPLTLISGMTAVDPTGAMIGETPYEQAVEAFRKLISELTRIGLGIESVIQTPHVRDRHFARRRGRPCPR